MAHEPHSDLLVDILAGNVDTKFTIADREAENAGQFHDPNVRVYPVSRSRELTQAAIRCLEAAGANVVWDWTHGPTRYYDERDSEIAVLDYRAVLDCDVLFMMWVEGMKGAYTELGMAFALEKRIVVVGCEGPNRNDNIFLRLPDIEFFPTIADGVAALKAA